MKEETKLPDFSQFAEAVAEKYPKKIAKKRTKAIVINDPDLIPQIQANVRTVPGIITQRGCTYAGCKGVIMGPTRDIVNITHGPIGCGFYSWLTRRNQTRPETDTAENYIPYCFSTDMQDSNIVFGGEEKLKEAIREVMALFNPKAIGVFSTCPVGLIGDDVHRVARQMEEEFPGVNIIGFSCEGYRGVSQSAGHHIANNQLYKNCIGKDDTIVGKHKYRVNLLGEYNIGGDAFVIEDLMDRCGIELIATMSGNATMQKFERAHTADLSLVMCHRSINYVAEMLNTSFGIPWTKCNFIGAEATAKSLRKIGEYFEDQELIDQIEKVIAEEMVRVEAAATQARKKTAGKTAMLFVGGSRAHHYQELFNELDMTTLAAGYEFGHRDDYEGRRVIPSIKIDADSRNIEEITVYKDEERYNKRKSDEHITKISDGKEFNDYEGLMADMQKGSLVIDDLSHYEMEKLIELYHPDVFCAGIKEKYVVQKMGIPLKMLHNYDSGGPYAGFAGAINFYKDIEMISCCSLLKYLKAPWESEAYVEASYVLN